MSWFLLRRARPEQPSSASPVTAGLAESRFQNCKAVWPWAWHATASLRRGGLTSSSGFVWTILICAKPGPGFSRPVRDAELPRRLSSPRSARLSRRRAITTSKETSDGVLADHYAVRFDASTVEPTDAQSLPDNGTSPD